MESCDYLYLIGSINIVVYSIESIKSTLCFPFPISLICHQLPFAPPLSTFLLFLLHPVNFPLLPLSCSISTNRNEYIVTQVQVLRHRCCIITSYRCYYTIPWAWGMIYAWKLCKVQVQLSAVRHRFSETMWLFVMQYAMELRLVWKLKYNHILLFLK